jgi:hypothetical protein
MEDGGSCMRTDVPPPATRWFLARLIFYPEDGGDTFLRNYNTRTTRRYIPEDNILNYRCENLKPYEGSSCSLGPSGVSSIHSISLTSTRTFLR